MSSVARTVCESTAAAFDVVTFGPLSPTPVPGTTAPRFTPSRNTMMVLPRLAKGGLTLPMNGDPVGMTRNDAFVLCGATVTTSVCCVFVAAPGATTTSSVIVSSSTTVTFWSAMSADASETVAPVRLRPCSTTGTVVPGSPAPGAIVVTTGRPAATTKNSAVVCPLSVVTISNRAVLPAEAPGSIETMAVNVPSSGVVTALIVIPVPVTTSAAPVRCAPVTVSATVVPTSAAA